MEYEWVEVDGLLSQVGRRIRKAQITIIIIPGNPGLPRFYEDFANILFENRHCSGRTCQFLRTSLVQRKKTVKNVVKDFTSNLSLHANSYLFLISFIYF